MDFTRRSALIRAVALGAGASAFLGARGSRAAEPVRFTSDPFKLGVASGDPSADGFVIWTRLAPEPFEPAGGVPPQGVEVRWTIAADPAFKVVVRAGATIAQPERAHAVHIELTGLESARPYWYRFEAGGVRSPVGRARTLPAAGTRVDRFKLAWVSCQHFEQGFFTPYRDLAAWEPELVLHLGDYIYESSFGHQLRRHPTLEPRTLDEYRVQHAVYKLDADLQTAHAAAPWAFIWDDHEVENDYAALVAANPFEQEGFAARRAAGYRAWLEHLPISRRSLASRGEVRIYQQLIVGDLVQILMLDTRQYRSPRACVTPERWRTGVASCPDMQAPDRTILGGEQEYWFGQTLDRSPARWTAIAQPSLMTEMFQRTPDGQVGGYQDGWSGYPVARQKLVDRIARRGKQDTVILGGDMHAYFACDVNANLAKSEGPVVASEFVVGSVTTQNYNHERWTKQFAEEGADHIRFFDDRPHGWAAAEVTPGRWSVDFRVAGSVWERNTSFRSLSKWAVEYGRAGVQPA